MPLPDMPPLPGDLEQAQAHGSRILRCAIDVAIANQARIEADPLADFDGWARAAAELELRIAALTEACVDAQAASQARWQ